MSYSGWFSPPKGGIDLRHIYMDNFRGFSSTLIPLRQVSFLVGENSTGKSSFLSLVNLMSQPMFWFSPERAFVDCEDFCGYNDIATSTGKGATRFCVGVVCTDEADDGTHSMSFHLYYYNRRNDVPHLYKIVQLRKSRLTKIAFRGEFVWYNSCTEQTSFVSRDQALECFEKYVRNETDSFSGYTKAEIKFPPNIPVPIVIEILESISAGIKEPKIDSLESSPMDISLRWGAPIRTRSRRFYDGIRRSYSPEGEHVPVVIRQRLKSKAISESFSKSLDAFGRASGLFTSVVAHSFGKGAQAPFELLIRFNDRALNISSVGYGVSQVLPLVVEFLTDVKARTFAVQQPEVHLHPRAQAALGE